MAIDKAELQAQVYRVHDTRQLLAQAQERLRAAEVVLSLVSEYQKVLDIKAHIKMLATDVQAEEELLRMQALAAFSEDGSTKPVAGVTIKHFKHVVFDTVTAFAWCMDNAPALIMHTLSPDYGKVAEKLPGAPIEVIYEPRVTIATDLSKVVTE